MAVAGEQQGRIQERISTRNLELYEAESDKLDGWAEDLKMGLEREIKEFDRQIREARRAALASLTLEEKVAAQKQVRAMESQRANRRRALFEHQDEIDAKRDDLISETEGKLAQVSATTSLFTIRWQIL